MTVPCDRLGFHLLVLTPWPATVNDETFSLFQHKKKKSKQNELSFAERVDEIDVGDEKTHSIRFGYVLLRSILNIFYGKAQQSPNRATFISQGYRVLYRVSYRISYRVSYHVTYLVLQRVSYRV